MGKSKEMFMNLQEQDENIEQKVKTKLFKASCHSISSIMGIKGLGEMGKTYAQEWVLKNRYGRKKDWYSKYVEKGLVVEETGITMLSQQENTLLFKNDEYFENDFIVGSPDIIHLDRVIDIKSSWSIYQFPFFETEIPKKEYYWQLQGYMMLTNLKKAALCYCLIDTPKPLIDQELKKLYYQTGGRAEDWTPETYAELAENYKFNDIPFKDKIKIFEIKRNDEDIERIKSRVLELREYIKTIQK